MSKTILIVEDNALNMRLFNDLLVAHGYRTVQTHDGRAVIDLARAENPDLILMDIQLPEISGLDVARMLKQENDLKHIPILAITAFAMKGDEEKILASGCQGYIAKPIAVRSFLKSVAAYLPLEV